MNYTKVKTVKLVDDNGADKAIIAEATARIAEREEVLNKRVKGGERAEGVLFGASRIVQDCESTKWKTIAERLNASRQMIAANTTPYQKDYFKYTARKA